MRVRLASLFPSRPAGSEKSILFYGYSAQNIRPPISGGGSLVRPIFKPPAEFLKARRLFGSSGPNRAPSKGWMATRERERNTRLEETTTSRTFMHFRIGRATTRGQWRHLAARDPLSSGGARRSPSSCGQSIDTLSYCAPSPAGRRAPASPSHGGDYNLD